MKCPHCDYAHGWDPVVLENIDGGKGDFYHMSNEVHMKRGSRWYDETRNIRGCPSCNAIFMSEY